MQIYFRSSLKSKMESDPTIPIYSLGMDLWSQHHSGYMGINLHYISKEWERIIFNLSCAPFNDQHTGLMISRKVHETLEDWNIESKVGLCLRDNAANMIRCVEPGVDQANLINLAKHCFQPCDL